MHELNISRLHLMPLMQVCMKKQHPPVLVALDQCPNELHQLLLRCFSMNHVERPTSQEALNELNRIRCLHCPESMA